MEWFDFVELMHYMVDTYGVPFGYGDETGEFKYPSNAEECEDAWFECPECGEPILYCDWKDEIDEYVANLDATITRVICPICENVWFDIDD